MCVCLCVCAYVWLWWDYTVTLFVLFMHTSATVSAAWSRKCLLRFILGVFHMTGTGGLSINYGIELFV